MTTAGVFLLALLGGVLIGRTLAGSRIRRRRARVITSVLVRGKDPGASEVFGQIRRRMENGGDR